MSKLQLRFGTAECGWLPVSVIVDDAERVFLASDVPSDFLTELASALDAFIGVGEGAAVMHEEPRATRWVLRTRGNKAELRIQEHESLTSATQNAGTYTVLVSVKMPPRDLALAVWRGLRALEGERSTRLPSSNTG